MVPGLLDVFSFLFVHACLNVGDAGLLVGQAPGLTVGVVMARVTCACLGRHVVYPPPQGVDDYVHIRLPPLSRSSIYDNAAFHPVTL